MLKYVPNKVKDNQYFFKRAFKKNPYVIKIDSNLEKYVTKKILKEFREFIKFNRRKITLSTINESNGNKNNGNKNNENENDNYNKNNNEK